MTLESQDGFPALSVASWQHDGFMQSLVGHEVFSGSASSLKSEKRPFDDDEQSMPATKEDFKEEVGLMIASLEAYEFSRTEAQNAGDNLLASSTNNDSIYEPMRIMTNPRPPKRFHRRGTLWASFAVHILLLARETARQTRRIYPSN